MSSQPSFSKVDIDVIKNRLSLMNSTVEITGKVTKVIGLMLESDGPDIPIGGLVDIKIANDKVEGEVVGFKDNRLIIMPFGLTKGIAPGAKVIYKEKESTIKIGDPMLGRVLDPMGDPLDNLPPPQLENRKSLYKSSLNPMSRQPITEQLDIGIRAINGMISIGKGQRIGIIAGAGVGKSTLLGMITKNTKADVIVVAMIGERGREVKEFISKNLDHERMKKTVLLVATSERPPLIRRRAAFYAMTVAEYFMEQNKNVLLILDSMTRLANAQREIGLSIGEPPTTKGYTPSLFTLLPELLERAGAWENKGSITGIFSVLVEADDNTDIIADTAKGILDGHITLSRKLAAANHYPAIDITDSISRVMPDLISKEDLKIAASFREIYSVYKDAEDMINIGAYKKGSSRKIDQAIQMIDKLNDYLKQDIDTVTNIEDDFEYLRNLFT